MEKIKDSGKLIVHFHGGLTDILLYEHELVFMRTPIHETSSDSYTKAFGNRYPISESLEDLYAFLSENYSPNKMKEGLKRFIEISISIARHNKKDFPMKRFSDHPEECNYIDYNLDEVTDYLYDKLIDLWPKIYHWKLTGDMEGYKFVGQEGTEIRVYRDRISATWHQLTFDINDDGFELLKGELKTDDISYDELFGHYEQDPGFHYKFGTLLSWIKDHITIPPNLKAETFDQYNLSDEGEYIETFYQDKVHRITYFIASKLKFTNGNY